MRKIVCIVLASLLGACGKIEPQGELKNKDLPLQAFDKIELSGKYRMFIVPNDKDFLNVETYENIGENLSIEVKDGTLRIVEKRPVGSVDFYNLTLYSKAFPKSISMRDSLEMNVSGGLKGEALRLTLQDYAKFIGAVDVQKLDMELKGNTRANLIGKAENMRLRTRDSANIISPYFQIKTLDIHAINATYTELDIKDTIKGSVQDFSKFMYYNDPIRAFKIDKNTKVIHGKLK